MSKCTADARQHNLSMSAREREPVVLEAGDLLDKFGFDDGDVLAPWAAQWAAQSWAGALLEPGEEGSHPLWLYVDDRRLLVHVVATRILPQLPSDLASCVTSAAGVHNPIRLWAPDGRSVSANWEAEVLALLEEIRVTVTRDEVFSLCDELFPPRTRNWIELHDALSWQFSLLDGFRQDPLQRWLDPAILLADRMHHQLGEDASRLLAQMLQSSGEGDNRSSEITLADLEDMARAAELCCRD